MTDIIQHLRGLLEKAEGISPAPWRGDRFDGTVKYSILDANGRSVCRGDNGNSEHGPYGFDSFEDESLVMAMRNALPTLLDQLAAQAAEIERLRQQAKDIEKWQKLALVAEDVTNDRIANLLENDTMAKGHSFSDVAAVFMRKANRLQRELNAAEVRMADLERWLEESREALRKIAVHVGGSVGEQCSHQFHLLVEDEVRLVMEKLRGGSNATKREKAVQVLRDCDEYIEVFSYEPEVCLDGWFTTDQVEAIAMGMHDLTIFKDADRL